MRSLLLSLFAFALVAGTFGSSSAGLPLQHERLRIRNTFKAPEEVVNYYCARDASGFVWSGLLDAERRAFTIWEEAPQQDSFYIAKSYEISPQKVRLLSPEEAEVEVRYELSAVGDAHGSQIPVTQNERFVTFNLKKVNGAWKIARPLPNQIAPVVLESKFNVSSASVSISAHP